MKSRMLELGCLFLVVTSFIATVEVQVEQVEAVVNFPSVKEIRRREKQP